MFGSISDCVVIIILPYRQAGFPVTFCSAASFSLRGCRVPSKALFTAKHLTVLGSFPNCSFKTSRRKSVFFYDVWVARPRYVFNHAVFESNTYYQMKKEVNLFQGFIISASVDYVQVFRRIHVFGANVNQRNPGREVLTWPWVAALPSCVAAVIRLW